MAGRRTAAAAAALPTTGDLAVVDDDAVHAYAVPGRQRRIVVTTGLLQRLSAPQRRALLAHEWAHLQHRHHVYVQLARIAAVVNPVLRPVSRAVDRSVERWADAEAVRAVGDRATVAQAIGIAALATTRAPRPALGAAGSDVVDRVRELLEPRSRRGGGGALLVLATLSVWVVWAAVAGYCYHAVELSEVVFRTSR